MDASGPIQTWCCLEHSVTTAEETVQRAYQSLCEWRTWLEKLAALFPTLVESQLSAEERLISIELAVPVLVNEVVAKTQANDMWWGHCEEVLSWFLEQNGIPEERRNELISWELDGYFESWTAPDSLAIEQLTRHIVTGLEGAVPDE